MRPGTRRWVTVLGVTIVGLLVLGSLRAGNRNPPVTRPHPRPVSIARVKAAAPSTTSVSPTSLAAQAEPTTTTTAPPPPLSVPTTRSTVEWVEQKATLTYQGLTRDYILYRPAGVRAARLPVVVDLAGCCESAQYEANRTNFRQVAGPAILVYPDYYQLTWNAGACCDPAVARHIDDVGFVNTVIDRVKAGQPDAAPGPVYLAGYSNGGKLAMEMACQEPTAIAAVAVYGATRTSPCTGPPPVSAMLMAGTADPEDSINGPPVVQNGFTEPTVNQMVSSYVAADGCTATRSTVTVGTAIVGRWASCAGSRLVQEVLFKGLNHAWPAGSGPTPSGQQVMWDFFSQAGA